MIVGIVVLVLVVYLAMRAKGRKSRLPALVHDYSDQRAVYQRWPTQHRRRFK